MKKNVFSVLIPPMRTSPISSRSSTRQSSAPANVTAYACGRWVTFRYGSIPRPTRCLPKRFGRYIKYVERIYNLPDIDPTGIRKGTELALRFLDIYTIWLPEWLGHYEDRRGKPRKDFRDLPSYARKKKDFQNLMTLATPAKFWTENYSKRSNKTPTR